MKKSHLLKMFSKMCAGVILINSTAYAMPVQTFSGLLSIGDDINEPRNPVGMNISIDGDDVFDINFTYQGANVNLGFGWDARANDIFSGTTQFIPMDGFGDSAKLFLAGEIIGPGSLYVGSSTLGSADTFGDFAGEFVPDNDPLFGAKRGYIGFLFIIDSNRHYGWADIEIDITGDFNDGFLNIYGYGYETNPDTAIAAGAGIAPLPASLYLFGSGILGLIGLSKRKQAALLHTDLRGRFHLY